MVGAKSHLIADILREVSQQFFIMSYELHRTPLLQALYEQDASYTAVVNHWSGATFTYGSLLRDIARARKELLKSKPDITGERIGFLVENGYSFVGKKALGAQPCLKIMIC